MCVYVCVCVCHSCTPPLHSPSPPHLSIPLRGASFDISEGFKSRYLVVGLWCLRGALVQEAIIMALTGCYGIRQGMIKHSADTRENNHSSLPLPCSSFPPCTRKLFRLIKCNLISQMTSAPNLSFWQAFLTAPFFWFRRHVARHILICQSWPLGKGEERTGGVGKEWGEREKGEMNICQNERNKEGGEKSRAVQAELPAHLCAETKHWSPGRRQPIICKELTSLDPSGLFFTHLKLK